MSFWSMRRTLERREPTLLSPYTIGAIASQLPNPSTHEKADVLLQSLTLLHPEPGKRFKLDSVRQQSLACARDERELVFFFETLQKRTLIEHAPGADYSITSSGWERAAQLATQPEVSRAAFVAMRFNDEMREVWSAAFAPAIQRAGFEPRLANDPQHNHQIDAHIIAELKQSRFVIADVTFAAAGVYFEAGYALGLGRPVIWTCRADREGDMHFDTRQYNHILWRDSAQLAEEIYFRIVATI